MRVSKGSCLMCMPHNLVVKRRTYKHCALKVTSHAIPLTLLHFLLEIEDCFFASPVQICGVFFLCFFVFLESQFQLYTSHSGLRLCISSLVIHCFAPQDNKHKLTLIMQPDESYMEKNDLAEKERLNKFVSPLTDSDKENLLKRGTFCGH